MLKVVEHFPEFQFAIAGAPSFSEKDYRQYLGNYSIPVIFNDTYNLVRHAKAAVVTSGTATLETALLKTPQVVVYKGNSISIGIARMLVNIKYISLVNLVMDSDVVKELIQEDCSGEKISAEIDLMMKNQTYRTNMLQNYEKLALKMGHPGASARAAELMISYLKL